MNAEPGGALDPVPRPVVEAEGGGIALTFDDGPNGEDTSALLDLLAGHGIRAVFCIVGESIRAPGGAGLLRRMAAEGHVLGNHSTDFRSLGALGAAAARRRMLENLGIIRDALGDRHAPVPFFRAPNGEWGVTAEVAVSLGMQPLAVANTIDDWRESDPVTLAANLRTAMRPGELVLVHDGGGDRRASVDAVRIVVEESLAAGVEFTLPRGAPAR
jgi:endo-1,4-beta-xylanase